MGEGREEIKVPDSIVKAMIQDKVGTAIVIYNRSWDNLFVQYIVLGCGDPPRIVPVDVLEQAPEDSLSDIFEVRRRINLLGTYLLGIPDWFVNKHFREGVAE